VDATWRLHAGGTSANKKVHQGAGKVLQEEAKRLYQVAKVPFYIYILFSLKQHLKNNKIIK
jgi:hypothetical protein